ncbi:AGE family epimerase/isomerase [Phycisphaerales bacterium AB-hyl4]|uniref:AGE family epimerase/isomerase n=1 Tax=Natronomicrosphaera hydrolytica TaxID=3242702 RepID=A0ABV4U7U5_9BACT
MNSTTAILPHLTRFYRKHLLDDVIGFWADRTEDVEHGGFLVPHDRLGHCTGTDKNIWCQGRQTYTFAELYQKIDRNPRWLELAKVGRDFLVRHAYIGEGRWRYLLNRQGKPINETPSFFTDSSVLMGLCAYAVASGVQDDAALIAETYTRLEQAFEDPNFNEFHHFNLDPKLFWMSPRMMLIGLAPLVRPIIGEDRLRPLLDRCLDDVLNTFANEEHRVVFEVLHRDGSVMHALPGRMLNPGHALEVSWFCMEEGIARNDQTIIDKSARMCDWMFRKGYDEQHGGLLAFVDAFGHQPPGTETVTPWGERWDDKVWWVHSEAMYALLLTAVTRDDAVAFERFLELHDYCQRYFADHAFGEWYEYLNRCGTPRSPNKGTWIKCAFHLPRNLIRIVHLLENQAGESMP